jgi:hypothetical protein
MGSEHQAGVRSANLDPTRRSVVLRSASASLPQPAADGQRSGLGVDKPLLQRDDRAALRQHGEPDPIGQRPHQQQTPAMLGILLWGSPATPAAAAPDAGQYHHSQHATVIDHLDASSYSSAGLACSTTLVHASLRATSTSCRHPAATPIPAMAAWTTWRATGTERACRGGSPPAPAAWTGPVPRASDPKVPAAGRGLKAGQPVPERTGLAGLPSIGRLCGASWQAVVPGGDRGCTRLSSAATNFRPHARAASTRRACGPHQDPIGQANKKDRDQGAPAVTRRRAAVSPRLAGPLWRERQPGAAPGWCRRRAESRGGGHPLAAEPCPARLAG